MKVLIPPPLFFVTVVAIQRCVFPFNWRTSLTCTQTISVQCFFVCGVHGTLSLMVKIFSLCLDQEFLPLIAGFPRACTLASHIYPCNFLVNFSEDQKYKFTFLEVVVNDLTVFPLNFDHCWLLLKIFHLSCSSKQ